MNCCNANNSHVGYNRVILEQVHQNCVRVCEMAMSASEWQNHDAGIDRCVMSTVSICIIYLHILSNYSPSLINCSCFLSVVLLLAVTYQLQVSNCSKYGIMLNRLVVAHSWGSVWLMQVCPTTSQFCLMPCPLL